MTEGTTTVPADWEWVRRSSDDELVGYLAAADSDAGEVVALTLTGHPLGEPVAAEAAVELLSRIGLSVLADPWLLTRTDGEEVAVLISSTSPGRVVVVEAPWGYPSPDAPHHVLSVPAPQLVPARRISLA